MSYDVLHSISRWTKTRLYRLGATVSDTEIIATEEQAWKGLSPSQRRLLELRGNLTVDTGGGGGGYVTKAVNSDGNVGMFRAGGAALDGVSDGPTGLFSTWVKSSDLFGDTAPLNSDGVLLDVPNGKFLIGSIGQVNKLFFGFNDIGNTSLFKKYTNTPLASNVWVNILAAWDLTADLAVDHIFQLYLTDVEYTDFHVQSDTDGALNVNYSAVGVTAGVGSDMGSEVAGPGLIGDIADYFFAPNQFLDLSVTANRRKFISAGGKPVDLGADGSTPTGTAPAIFFSRDSNDPASFATNKGNGGAFDLIGASLTAATTSPSD